MNQRISVTRANLLYLLCILLVAIVGSITQAASPTWGLLFTEVALILVPALLAMRISRVSIRPILRPNFPQIRLSAACFFLGVAAWLLDGYAESVINQIIYLVFKATPLGLSILPKNMGQAILYALGFVIFAPICEEILFRGTIQRAYQPLGAIASILIPGSLFALFHMRLLGLIPLLPIALLISYVYHRTESLGASMLVHLGNNLLVGIQLILFTIDPALTLPLPSLFGALIGIILLVACLYILLQKQESTRLETEQPIAGVSLVDQDIPILEQETPKKPRFTSFLPLVAAVGIYLLMAGVEFISVFFPGILALNRSTAFTTPDWQEPLALNYTIYNKNDEAIGNAYCTMIPGADILQMDCQTDVRKFEFTKGSSYYSSDSYQETLKAAWKIPSVQLDTFEKIVTHENFEQKVVLEKQGEQGTVRVYTGEETQQTTLPDGAGIADAMPFHLMMANFAESSITQFQILYPSYYNKDIQKNEPTLVTETVIISQDLLPQDTGGYTTTWMVRLGKDVILWYETDSPHRLVRMENKMYTYVLEPGSDTGAE